jgi:hypothetical protein
MAGAIFRITFEGYSQVLTDFMTHKLTFNVTISSVRFSSLQKKPCLSRDGL